MKVVRSVNALRSELQAGGIREVGLVPTMGYLHEGHMSLVRASLEENQVTVVSIFVNPTQFAPTEDLDRYPRDLSRDGRVLEEAGVDFLFAPTVEEIYPPGFVTRIDQAVLGDHLCGSRRPGHFSGVLTVVAKLMGIASPRRAYFGGKDAQQAVMVSRMVRDLNLDVQVRIMPIVRDAEGLALSSRNQYLSPDERSRALALPRALGEARRRIDCGENDAASLVRAIRERIIGESGIQVEYVEVVGLNDLQPIDRIDPEGTLVAAAVRVGNTRLIDNFILGDV